MTSSVRTRHPHRGGTASPARLGDDGAGRSRHAGHDRGPGRIPDSWLPAECAPRWPPGLCVAAAGAGRRAGVTTDGATSPG